MFKALDTYQKGIYYVLIGLLAIIIGFSVIELAYLVFQGLLFDESRLRLENHEILGVLGLFLLVLIGIELLETIRTYIEDHRIHVEVILLVALIAVARKIILLDSGEMNDLTLIGIGFVIIALSGGYYLVKKAKAIEKVD
ncbi:MAG: phosphate-starvation-inducible PsiE family protein [Methanofollis sp.]|uniref:phosphate-starvation-inducible PsiE family protein n=1 Tax=Methanofollis sp. TaxID=2052835 RepID=UPI00260BDB33|nr:phosphate-starvation-inducible PsiE family protein [Methanofollis sp.]MDD4255640.1 phosphate-starvation-inducible PsiE family protein [Methanofollis sp.]